MFFLNIFICFFCQKLPTKPSNPKLGVFWKTQEICSPLLQTETKRTTPCKGVCLSLKLHTDSNYQDICNDQFALLLYFARLGRTQPGDGPLERRLKLVIQSILSKAIWPKPLRTGMMRWQNTASTPAILTPSGDKHNNKSSFHCAMLSGWAPGWVTTPSWSGLSLRSSAAVWSITRSAHKSCILYLEFQWYFEFPTPCLGKQKPSGFSDHTYDHCGLQLCSSWQFGKNADIWKWKWTKWTSFWVNVRERCCLLRLSPGVHLWWWTVCRHRHQ